MPDIDLDFARDIREQLILQVYERYGHEHAALVCSFATYHLRSAVRDLGKVLGLPAPAIDKLARLSEGGSASSVRRELATLPEFQGQAEGPMWAHLMDLAEQIDSFPRHVGQHVGGMIISSRPVVELVPVQSASMAAATSASGTRIRVTTRGLSRSIFSPWACCRWSRSASS